MSIIADVLIVVAVVAAVVVYQLVKSKKAVTVGDVKAQVSTDAAAVKSDVAAVKSDVKKS